jgi:hypothetical protein
MPVLPRDEFVTVPASLLNEIVYQIQILTAEVEALEKRQDSRK